MAAFDGDDLTKLSELYTEDCKVMPTGSDVMSGREGTRASSTIEIISIYSNCAA